ncbi:MAG TPA: alcohol dehydrogenase catalytic domain-containing protein [Actinocrinis sp.]|uniref:alcohol dehydrogenase catalytic domain-containing protein n=1 Tax=Actinocrinis sp. TaxID=1920516 RepID=UPI002DDCF11B|nr:alcohol dehydrogenase catalytic domain-containing protein [Actinocrinis sp.]HEV2342914.1 alcohol dehydrogenase catalytic domain-containing protein [Actinocrinis sp.]
MTVTESAGLAQQPDTMLTAAIVALRAPLELRRVPRPVPGPEEVLVHIRAAGVCHTDLHLVDGVPDSPHFPLVPGHEIAGRIAAVGEDVSRRRVGESVSVYYYDGCGECGWCGEGLENLCRAAKSKWGFNVDGGFAEYVCVPARCALPIPEGLSFAEAAVLGCSGTTGVHVVEGIAGVRHGEAVVVIGAGGVGLAAVQVACAAGATVIAVDPDADSRAAAVGVGAKDALDPGRAPAAQQLRALMPEGCDVVVDTVGDDATPRQAIAMVRPRGRVVLVGYTERAASIDVADIVTREVRVYGSVGATLAEARRTFELAAHGLLRPVIADTYPLERVGEALARLRGGRVTGRLVLEP